jgi:hypothetical protein
MTHINKLLSALASATAGAAPLDNHRKLLFYGPMWIAETGGINPVRTR